MTNREFLDEIKAEEELRDRGYTQVACEVCKGDRQLSDGDHRWICHHCDGKGFFWSAPIRK